MEHKPIYLDGIDVSECKCLHNVKVITELAQPEDFEILCGATNGAIKCEKWKDCYYKQLKRKEQECERLKWYLKEIRYDELKALDIEWDEYETHCIDSEYSNIINLVEEALKERSPEDCRYDR